MNIPFTSEQFLEVFKNYNLTVWPVQIVLYLLAIIAIYLAVRAPKSGRIISIILSILWMWMGIVYHLIFFTEINKAAYLFGALFILQGILFFYFGFIQNRLVFQFQSNLNGVIGSFLIIFSLIIYPVFGYFLNHGYPYSPSFGLPCPTTIFTFGVLLWLVGKCPLPVLVIPTLWSIVGFSAALSLGMFEDISLIIFGLMSFLILIVRNKTRNFRNVMS